MNEFTIERKNGKKRVRLTKDNYDSNDRMDLNVMTNGFQSAGCPVDEEIIDMIKMVIDDFDKSGNRRTGITLVDAESTQHSSIMDLVDDYIEHLNKTLKASREGHIDRASYEISVSRDTMINFQSMLQTHMNGE